MEKVKINMIGGGFQHDVCTSSGSVPKYVEWVKDKSSNISIHIDDAIKWPTDRSKKNYAWLVESSAIIPQVIQWIPSNIPYLEENYDDIFTCDKRLFGLSNKFKLTLCASTVPRVKNCGIHPKTKMVSMITSAKTMCPGHNYRLTKVEKYRGKVDHFGLGFNYIDKKETGLNDYFFSFAMLNDYYPNYFTEILTDCFATGAVPIYLGHPFINEFFNEDGIIVLTDDFKVEDLSTELYYSKMDAIKDNFERIMNLPISEDYLYEKYIK